MQLDNDIQIREVLPEDMEDVISLLQSLSKFEPEIENSNQLAASFLTSNSQYACVALKDKRVIGFASVFLLQRIRGGVSAIIEDVIVGEDARHMGVGRLLISSLLGYASARKCFKVGLVTTEENIAFYETLGFRKDLQGMRLLLKSESQR